MYPMNRSNGPGFGPGYVPYFYESGLFASYTLPPTADSSRSSYAPAVAHQPLPRGHPGLAPDGLQTVEQIIQHGYLAVPQADPIAAILSDKQHTSWLGLDDLILQSRDRLQIYQQNVQEIEQGKCEAWNSLFRLEADQGHPANDRQHYAADKRLQDLYDEQRSERVTLWRDLSRLRLAVPEIAQQYLSAHRTIAALNMHGGDEE